jgi:hypothetical protein
VTSSWDWRGQTEQVETWPFLVPLRMRRPTATLEPLGCSPLVEARRAHSSGMECVPHIHTCPHEQDQRSSLRGDRSQSGQRIRGPEGLRFFCWSGSRSETTEGLSVRAHMLQYHDAGSLDRSGIPNLVFLEAPPVSLAPQSARRCSDAAPFQDALFRQWALILVENEDSFPRSYLIRCGQPSTKTTGEMAQQACLWIEHSCRRPRVGRLLHPANDQLLK